MPELPEVETVKCVLEPHIIGLKINEAIVEHPKVIAFPDAAEFKRALPGQKVRKIERRGKFILIHLESRDRIVIHLRMTGCLFAVAADETVEKHTHIIIKFNNGTELRFNDTRRFGRFWFISAGMEDTYSGIGKLGLEPFDKNFSAEYLKSRCGMRKKAVKECLLDQTIVAGIGNIYSDEILFRAKIHPSRSANSLSDDEWQCLANIIPECLSFFIKKNKTTLKDYAAGKGRNYRNTPYLQVYGHAQEPCPVCGTLLCKETIGGRSSVFCPCCQVM